MVYHWKPIYTPTQDKEHDQLIILSQLEEQLMAYSDEPILLPGVTLT